MSTPKRALSILNPSKIKFCEEEEDAMTERFIRIVTMAHRQGASIRVLAKCFNMSKSTMGRIVQMIEAANLGQHGENSPANSTAAQLPSVPNGTVPDDEAT
jgi:hypothetical protein